MQQEALGLWHCHTPGQTYPPYEGTECYFLSDGQEGILVDCGDGTTQACERLRAAYEVLGRPHLKGILLTHVHADHSGGAPWAAAYFQAPLWLHPKDCSLLRAAERRAALWSWPESPKLQVGQQCWQIIEAPGHTPGSVVLWRAEDRWLLAGDTLLPQTTSIIAPPEGNVGDYLQTLRRLKGLGAMRVAPGHGPLIADGLTRIEAYEQRFAEREDEILAGLGRGPRSALALAKALYQDRLAPSAMGFGAAMLTAHLQDLQRRGHVRQRSDGRFALRRAPKEPKI